MTSSETPYHFEKFDGVSVITLPTELNDVPWADIEDIGSALVEQMEAQKKPTFLIDLDALTYMGSAMVALVVRLWKSVKERNGKMVVVNSDEMVLEVLSIAGLDDIWTIVDTRAEGFKALGISTRKIRSQGMIPGESTKESSTSKCSGIGISLLTLLTIVIAGAGLYLLLFPQQFIQDQRVILGLLFGGSLLGLMTGTVVTIVGRGIRRGIGILGVVTSVGIMVAGVFNTPNLRALLQNDEKKIDSNANDEQPVDGTIVNSISNDENEKSKTPDAKEATTKIAAKKTVLIKSSKPTVPTITTAKDGATDQRKSDSQTDTDQKKETEQ